MAGGFLFNMTISLAIGLSLSNLYRFAQPAFLRRFPGRVAYLASHVLIVGLGAGVGVEVALRIITALGGPNVHALRTDVLRIALVVTVVVTAIAVSYETLRERARRVELKAERAQQQALELSWRHSRRAPTRIFCSIASTPSPA